MASLGTADVPRDVEEEAARAHSEAGRDDPPEISGLTGPPTTSAAEDPIKIATVATSLRQRIQRRHPSQEIAARPDDTSAPSQMTPSLSLSMATWQFRRSSYG